MALESRSVVYIRHVQLPITTLKEVSSVSVRVARRPRPFSGVAFEFGPVKIVEHVARGVVEEAPALGGDPAALALGGFDEVLGFELLECGPDDLPAALGLPRRGDAVAVRAVLGVAVGGREPVDPDLAVDGDPSEQAGRARSPELLLFGGEFAARAGLRVGRPGGAFDALGKAIDERVDECVRRNVVESCHTDETLALGVKRVGSVRGSTVDRAQLPCRRHETRDRSRSRGTHQ